MHPLIKQKIIRRDGEVILTLLAYSCLFVHCLQSVYNLIPYYSDDTALAFIMQEKNSPICSNGLILMSLNAQECIAVPSDLKVKTIVVINPCLPDIISFVMFLCTQGRITNIAREMRDLFFKLILNAFGQFYKVPLKMRGVLKAHIFSYESLMPAVIS